MTQHASAPVLCLLFVLCSDLSRAVAQPPFLKPDRRTCPHSMRPAALLHLLLFRDSPIFQAAAQLSFKPDRRAMSRTACDRHLFCLLCSFCFVCFRPTCPLPQSPPRLPHGRHTSAMTMIPLYMHATALSAPSVPLPHSICSVKPRANHAPARRAHGCQLQLHVHSAGVIESFTLDAQSLWTAAPPSPPPEHLRQQMHRMGLVQFWGS